MTTEELMPVEVREELKRINEVTKKEFNVIDRIKNRGLRRGQVTLYLDEEVGPELGWAHDARTLTGAVIRERAGVVGEIDEVLMRRELAVMSFEEADNAAEVAGSQARADRSSLAEFDKEIEVLEARRLELQEKLDESAIVVNLRAVPPVIEEDTHRLARQTLGIEEKGVPADREEEFKRSKLAHLMTKVITSIRSVEDDSESEGCDYDTAIYMVENLPTGQFHRLDLAIGRVQYTDAISRSIEGQEDF